MGTTTGGLSVFAANLAGSSVPYKIAIGISGIAYASGNTALGSETDRNLITSTDLSTTKQVTLISTFTPNEISGTIMREFGTFTSGNVMIDRTALTGSLVFDGEQELQVQETFSFFISGV
jgi:hypothetical protein